MNYRFILVLFCLSFVCFSLSSQSTIVLSDSTRVKGFVQEIDNFVVYKDSINSPKSKQIGIGRVAYVIQPDGSINAMGRQKEKELIANGTKLYKNALRLSFFGPAQDMIEVRYERATQPGVSFLASAGIVGISPTSRLGVNTTGGFFTLSGRIYDRGYCRPSTIKNKRSYVGTYLQMQLGYEAYSSEVLYSERTIGPSMIERITGDYNVNALTTAFGGGLLFNITPRFSADLGLAMGYAFVYNENISHTLLPDIVPVLHHAAIADSETKFIVNWTFQIGYNF